jgi:c-di-GMP-related signal transduction protein
MELFVARQPIFDRNLNVLAYEVLFRSGLTNSFDGTEANTATSKVISAVFYSPNGEDVLGGKPAFINFPERLLLNDGASILPPASTVIEVLETVQPDASVVAACAELHSRGYKIALDDFVDTELPHPLAPVADFIKVDLRASTKQQQKSILARYRHSLSLLAEKVETQEEFEEAADMGFTYFQGYFFAKPIITSSREIPGFKLNYLRILQEIHRPEIEVKNLTKLVAREPGLSYKLLRYVNSAAFARLNTIESIEQALVFVGQDGIRRWLSVVALMDLTSDKPSELAVSALVRARFCELLAPEAGLSGRSGDLFLVGMFSHLDAMLGRPLDELLDGLKLNDDIRNTLAGTAAPGNRFAAVWKVVLAYEAADWTGLAESARMFGIKTEGLSTLYAAAVKWAGDVFRI